MSMPEQIFITELTDFGGTLAELLKIVNELSAKYGQDAKLFFDAGYNNVQVYIERELEALDDKLVNPIPLEVLREHGHLINWDGWYGRFGTETNVFKEYCNHYTDQVPQHLAHQVTHVWVYVEK